MSIWAGWLAVVAIAWRLIKAWERGRLGAGRPSRDGERRRTPFPRERNNREIDRVAALSDDHQMYVGAAESVPRKVKA